jgi:hypothetical protein
MNPSIDPSQPAARLPARSRATGILTASVGLAALLTGCATDPAAPATEPRIPGATYYDVRIQPARISPNPQGAFLLSAGTGCDVVYVTKAAAADTVSYAMRPTSRIPDAKQCLELLKEQPGVEAVSEGR